MKQIILFCLILLTVGLISAQQPVLLRNAQYLDFGGTNIGLPNGATMIFWNDTSSGSSDVLAQKLSSEGAVLWTAPRVVASSAEEEKVLSAVLTSDNNILVLYRSYSVAGDILSQWVQKFSQAGQPLWGEQGILITDANYYYSEACLVPNAIGAAYVIYKTHYPSTEVYGMNLDNFGTNLWPHIPLGSFTGLYEVEAVEDGSGGLILNCQVSNGGGSIINQVLRIDAAGDVVGSNPLLSPTAVVPPGFSILKDSQGNYLLYQFQADVLSMQKMDVNGNLLLLNIVTIANPNPVYTSEYKLKPTPGGGIAYLNSFVSYENASSLTLHYLNSALQEVWAQPTVISLTSQISQLQLDVSNGIWLSWIQFAASGNYDDNMVCGTRIDTNGSLAFPPVAISNGDKYKQRPILRSLPNKALVVWNDHSTDHNLLRAQLLSGSGSLLLEPDGRDVYGVLNGSADLQNIHKLGSNYLHIYEDTRNEWDSRLYVQLTSDTGNPQLETNGRALNPGSDYPEDYLDSKLTAANTTMLLYSVYENAQHSLWLQELNSAGSPLWPGNGISVASSVNSGFEGSLIGQMGNDILVVWPEWIGGTGYQSLRGQRFSSSVAQWPAGGKLLVEAANTYIVPEALQGDYLIYYEENYTDNSVSIKVLKLGATGDPYAGWPQGGISVMPGASYHEGYMHSGVVNGDLVVFMSCADLDYNVQTVVQKISPSAQVIWGASGLVLAENDIWFSFRILDAVYDNNITWLEQDTETNRVSVRRINQAGEFLWGETGCEIINSGPEWQDAKMAKFANGTTSVFHTSNTIDLLRTIKRHDIGADGSLLSTEPVTIVSAIHYLGSLKLSADQDSGLISWNDYNSYELKRGDGVSFCSLWTTRIDAYPTSVDDPLIPQPLHSISNYPNPFRAGTTISFGLKDASPVKVDIYNLKGQHVRSLLDEAKTAGEYQLQWDARDEQGRKVSDGIYLYKIQAGKFSSSKKMILLK